jgi:hypothetical protein
MLQVKHRHRSVGSRHLDNQCVWVTFWARHAFTATSLQCLMYYPCGRTGHRVANNIELEVVTENKSMLGQLGQDASKLWHQKNSHLFKFFFNYRICMQVEICLNDARQNPAKYQSLYPCDFEKSIAPKLSVMKGGRRLSLARAGTSTAHQLDRLICALLHVAV